VDIAIENFTGSHYSANLSALTVGIGITLDFGILVVEQPKEG